MFGLSKVTSEILTLLNCVGSVKGTLVLVQIKQKKCSLVVILALYSKENVLFGVLWTNHRPVTWVGFETHSQCLSIWKSSLFWARQLNTHSKYILKISISTQNAWPLKIKKIYTNRVLGTSLWLAEYFCQTRENSENIKTLVQSNAV